MSKKGTAKVMLTEEQIPVYEEFSKDHEDILKAVANGGAEVGYDTGYVQATIAAGLSLLAAAGIIKLIEKLKK